jgi:hypothetical protein
MGCRSTALRSNVPEKRRDARMVAARVMSGGGGAATKALVSAANGMGGGATGPATGDA